MIVALLALFIALGGTATAAGLLITGRQVKDESLTGRDIRNNTVKGADVLESSLARVPSSADAVDASHAIHADNATTANTASKAGNADTLDGIDSTGFLESISANASIVREAYAGNELSPPVLSANGDTYTTIARIRDLPAWQYVLRAVAAVKYTSPTSGDAAFVQCRLAIESAVGTSYVSVKQDYYIPTTAFNAVLPVQTVQGLNEPATIELQCNGGGGAGSSWERASGTSVIAHRVAYIELVEMP
jgi:hypothetical protein